MTENNNEPENNEPEFAIPSDPNVRQKIKDAVAEAAGALMQIEDKRSFIKDIKDDVFAEYKVPKKVFNKMIKAYHKHAFTSMVSENNEFQEFYEIIMGESATPE